ncbi:JmjC domain-containing protein [Parasedimentitalea maritima]|uniref:JmjC domain-containing protein n=1 Tax=Parasedimentitalea maritima TaxID=2578117 RepID=A0A6A4R6N0_9RHOB|nr:cupin domain-containing protein [Zongyanglinia marina]KAE9624744.1 hypothetical protein GP644_23200 [Zongyanglinia marina]
MQEVIPLHQSTLHTSTICGPDFWREFAEQYWERASGAFPGVFASPPIPPSMAFEAAVGLADAARSGNVITDPCIWLDGQKLPDPVPHLPMKSDKTFEAYGSRLRRETGAREYTALFPELHYYDARLLRAARQILRDVVGACGLPSGWSDTALFVGDYERTPFGIHYGPMSVLTVPVIGRKTFRVWTEEEIAMHQELVGVTRYDAGQSRSKLLNASPGDLVYWPSREWHIAEAEAVDGPTAALSFGFWTSHRECHPLRQVAKISERLLTAKPAPPGRDLVSTRVPAAETGDNSPLPEGWAHYLDELQALVHSGDLETELMGEYLRQSSCFGLKEVPPVLAETVDKAAPIVLDPLAGLCTSRRGETLLVAVFGQVFTVPYHSGLLHLLSVLKERPVGFCEFETWFDVDPVSLSVDDAWSVIEYLASLGAVMSDAGQLP